MKKKTIVQKKVLEVLRNIVKIVKMKSDDEKSMHPDPSKRVPVAEKE